LPKRKRRLRILEGYINLSSSSDNDNDDNTNQNNRRHCPKRRKTNEEDFRKDLAINGKNTTVHSESWNTKFCMLQRYKEHEGDCNVPNRYKENGKALGSWLENQRARKKKGKLDLIRVKKLEDIGVVWDMYSDAWNIKFRMLQRYKERKGDCNLPFNYKENGVNLGMWLPRQRTNKQKGILDATRVRQLNSIGIVWDLYQEQWEKMYRLLVEFQQPEGHCSVLCNYQVNGIYLYRWLHSQRVIQKKGMLDATRENRLKDLGVF